jgi:hypothetical protein
MAHDPSGAHQPTQQPTQQELEDLLRERAPVLTDKNAATLTRLQESYSTKRTALDLLAAHTISGEQGRDELLGVAAATMSSTLDAQAFAMSPAGDLIIEQTRAEAARARADGRPWPLAWYAMAYGFVHQTGGPDNRLVP